MFFLRKISFQLKKYSVRYWKHLFLIGLILFAIGFILIIFESLLSSDNTERWNQTLRNEDFKLLKSHFLNAKNHPFGFNDHPYTEKKTNPCFRLIILGDSVVFGDGLQSEQIWSHKLEKKLKQRYPVEVLHWGQCGWSTLDQLNFLRENFSDKENIFSADLLLISWVGNDPDMGINKVSKLRRLFSNPFFNSFIFFFPKIGAIFCEFIDSSEYTEFRSRLYTDENLLLYRKVLHDLKSFCLEKNTDLFFVILSNGKNESREEFSKIESLLQMESIPCFNFHPSLTEQVLDVPVQNLYASAVNRHPGPLLTTLYARYTLPELVKRYGKKMMEMGSELKKNNEDYRLE